MPDFQALDANQMCLINNVKKTMIDLNEKTPSLLKKKCHFSCLFLKIYYGGLMGKARIFLVGI